jgi:protein-S-isoprenylcysteine O-methyltransferase Ste14
LIPLLTGFVLAGASAFTAAYSRRWGERGGRLATSLLRNVLGIPLYFYGLVLAWQAAAPLLFASGAVNLGLGWILIVAGAVPVIIGHLHLGWRTHMPSIGDSLMSHGLYAYVRHPIYAGSLLVFGGLALLQPDAPWLLACALSGVFFTVMGRLEEIDLLQRMPEYREYMARVPRFIPHVFASRWGWLCPLLGLAMGAGVLYLWGLSLWTAILAALMLACPITILWGLMTLRRYPQLQPGKDADFSCCRKSDEKGEGHDR